MTHDPLCYMTECMHPDPHSRFKATCGYCTAYCVCQLIAKVRADTLDRARELITALACPITIAEGHCEECEQYREALACIDFLSNEIASKEKKPRELRAKWKPLKKGGFKMRWKFKKAKND